MVIARNAEIAIGIASIIVTRRRFAIDMFVVREDERALDPRWPAQLPADHLAVEELHLEVAFANGHIARVDATFCDPGVRSYPERHSVDAAGESIVRPLFWVQPLPPTGPITLTCVWLHAEVPRTPYVIDSAPILDAIAHLE